MAKVDMHCHSYFSDRPVHWLFYKAGARESYIQPAELYRRLKRRGMDLVTITDHDTIAGALEIAAEHEDAFVSCEFTVRFYREPVETHICAYGLTEVQFREGRRLARDVREFAAYFREQGVVTAVPHPFHNMRGQMKVRHLEQLVLLFENFEELSGVQQAAANQMQQEFLDTLSPEIIDDLIQKYGIHPAGDEPWIKGRLGGSDDHSSFFLGRAWTEVNGVSSTAEFLQGIRERRSRGRGLSNNALVFAHSAHANTAETLMNNFCDAEAPLHRRAAQMAELAFGDHIHEVELAARLKDEADGTDRLADDPSDEEMLTHGLVRIIMRDWHDPNLLNDRVVGRDLQEETFTIINTLFNTLVRRAITQWLDLLRQGRIMEAFTKLSLIYPTGIVAVPYIMGYQHFHSDNAYRRRIAKYYDLHDPLAERPEKWAWFTDTIMDVNGVARTIQTVTGLAEQHDTPITTVTSHPTAPFFQGHLKNFKPIHTFQVPEYELMSMSIPPLLEMLRYCEKSQFTRFIISTPGPVGLVALWIAKILDIPTAAIYHTDVPEYARVLTGDQMIEELAWHLVRLLYGKVDQVYVLTEAYRENLLAHGLKHDDIRIFPKGTDVELFHPDRRDREVWERYGLNGSTKILYVGRVSREKGLDVLTEAYDRLRAQRDGVELVIVGDGPYLAELEARFGDHPGVVFTGFVEGEDLARLYASADIFAFPSTTDTFGSVILEAQASGLPVVVTDKGGPREVIEEGTTGLVARGNNIESFTETLLTLVDDNERRDEMGYQGRLLVENRTWESAFRSFWEGQQKLHFEPSKQ